MQKHIFFAVRPSDVNKTQMYTLTQPKAHPRISRVFLVRAFECVLH